MVFFLSFNQFSFLQKANKNDFIFAIYHVKMGYFALVFEKKKLVQTRKYHFFKLFQEACRKDLWKNNAFMFCCMPFCHLPKLYIRRKQETCKN